MLGSPVNPIRITLFGGYPPGTEGNPRPYGMPAFANELSNSEVADVLTFVRSAWGDDASAVSPIEVDRNSGSPLW
jgi:mono/diheme cytochrome c family protein